MVYPVHLWNAGITSITVERVVDAVSGQYGECSFMGGYTIMGPNQHGDCWIRKEVTAADFEAHHWEGRLLVVNATVVTSAMDGNGTLTEDPVTASAAFDLPYNADIQYHATTSLVELPNGGKSCFSVSFCTWQTFCSARVCLS